MLTILLELLKVFVPLSFLAVGGGQSILPAIHRESVQVHHWITNPQFLDLFALSRLTPGPGSLLVTLVGWQAGGVAGALVASIGVFVPSALLVFCLAKLWARFQDSLLIKAIEAGLVPVAAGMILAGTGTVLKASEGGAWAWGVAVGSALALRYTRISPFLLFGVGGVLFIVVRP